MSQIPIVDVSRLWSDNSVDRKVVAEKLDEACRSIGFLVIIGHGVMPDLRQRMYATTRAFFDLPTNEKLAFGTATGGGYRGYTPLASESLAKTLGQKAKAADLYEAFTMGRPDTPSDAYYEKHRHNFFAPNIWPDRPPAMKSVWLEYYKAMEGLAAKLMHGFALALNLDEDYFDDKFDKHISNMRAINYPDQPNHPLPGQVRSGAHTDYGSLTILFPDAAPGGLQVLAKSGEWQSVPYVPDAFVINLGDLLAEWTNDRWVSTLHRVANPPRDKAVGSRRQSIAFFHQPNYDAIIECIPTCTDANNPARHAPIRSGEHLQMKIRRQAAA
ncbi:MAG TPA: 2-oxoglutarate and iron-dependent oxygenase domain-containing protein [Xanthobacteraceae bacterium]|nr:2-oxoglutarate and iron-dependent oxygenase domain-containing protein [Xanthobacteraceae bacterium]